MFKTLLTILLLMSAPNIIFGQNTFAALQSNYTPTNSLYINPTSMLDAKTWLDINIIGAGAFANNNLVYVKDRSTIGLLKNDIDSTNLEYKQGRKNYSAFARGFVAGPSAVWSQGNHAIGLSTAFRSYTGAQRVPTFVGPFIQFGVADYVQQHEIDYSIKKLRTASINFAQIQLSYGHTLFKKQRKMLMFGFSVKKMYSVAGAAGNVNEFNFNVQNDSIARLDFTNADLMYSNNQKIYTKGGLGLDLGFTYQKMLGEAASYYPNSYRNGCRYVPYKYKIGISIIDIGSVKFDPDNTRYVGYEFSDFANYNYQTNTFNEDTPTDIFINQETDPSNGQVKKTDRIRLPTFVSIQADYNLYASKVYVNATLIHGMPVSSNKFGIRHVSSLSVAPRFESKWFDFGLALSMYEYQYAQLGASLRFAYFTIGSDKLVDLLMKNKLYGSDIYVYVKIPFFYHPKCKSKLKKTGNYDPQKIKRRSNKCDAYN